VALPSHLGGQCPDPALGSVCGPLGTRPIDFDNVAVSGLRETEAGERLFTVTGSAYNAAMEDVQISTTLVEQVAQSSESCCYIVSL
jgi:hypothetical protein